ncbi:hypothetical protein D9M70_607100 [compost metagenome]
MHAGGDVLLDLEHGILEHHITTGAGYGVEGIHQRHASGEGSCKGASEARYGRLVKNVADDG